MTGPQAPPGMDRRPSRQTEAPETQTTADLKSDSTLTQPDPFDLFDMGLRLGLAYGRRAGIVQGREDEDAEWQAHMGVLRDVVTQPRQAELEAARQFTPGEPCYRKCRRCSRCVHALAYWQRGGRDYPGDGAA
jgi:hypothetical protein